MGNFAVRDHTSAREVPFSTTSKYEIVLRSVRAEAGWVREISRCVRRRFGWKCPQLHLCGSRICASTIVD